MVSDRTLQNLESRVSFGKFSDEKKRLAQQKSVEARLENKKNKEKFAIGAKFAFDVLKTKKEVNTKNGKKKMCVYDMAIERLIEIIMDKEHPRYSLQALELLKNLTEGDPKLYQQININMNNVEQKENLGNDINAEYERLIGHKFEKKEEAETVEAVIHD